MDTARRSRRTALTGAALALGTVLGSLLLGDVPAARADMVEADCAGAVGDSAVAQAAIDASAPGDEVVFHGTCLLDRTLQLADARTYRGDGRAATILRQADGANLPALVATDTWSLNQDWTNASIRIERLTIDANRDANTGTHGLVLRAWDSRVYDIEVGNAAGDGIHVTSLSADGTVLKPGQTQVNSIIADVYVHHNDGNGIRVDEFDGQKPDDDGANNKVTDWIIERAWIDGTGESGLSLENAAGWQIRDLHLYDIGENAIDAHRCYNTGIHDNYVEDFGGAGGIGEEYFGIRCTLQGDVPNTIAGNKVNLFGGASGGAKYVSIGLDGVNYGAGYATVTGNAIVGTGTRLETGLAYRKGNGDALTVVSTGNLVTRVGTARKVGTGVTVTVGQ